MESYENHPYIAERCPVHFRENPVDAPQNVGTPFQIKPNSFSGTALKSHHRVGSYFVHLLFFYCLWRAFRGEKFQRLNLDAKRLGYLLSDGVIEYAEPNEPECATSYYAWLRINVERAKTAFPAAFMD